MISYIPWNKVKNKLWIAMLCSIAFLLCGCRGTQALPPEITVKEEICTPKPTAVPTPEPVPETVVVPSPAEEELREQFFVLLRSLPTDCPVMEKYAAVAPNEYPGFQDIRSLRESITFLADEINQLVEGRCLQALEQLYDLYPDTQYRYELEFTPIDWKYLGAILWTLPEDFDFTTLFSMDCAVSTESDTLWLHVMLSPINFSLFAQEHSGEERDTFMHARFLKSYLTTIYDDAGEEVDYVQPTLAEEYIVAMGKPLKRTKFADRWYQGRSNNTRKHTGLDMHGAANQYIFSCTDGTVLYVGFDAVAGNYVIIRDDLGYEYHYYHMVRKSAFLKEGQRVKKGDHIGNVGNTGNSSVNHLHLALIDPQDRYVRLYDVMKAKYGK